MKTLIQTAFLFAVASISLLACTSQGCKSSNAGYPPADTITQQAAYERILATINELNEVQWLKQAGCDPTRPCLTENIWQYIFRTSDINFSSGDTWRLHKAYDPNSHEVCIVLEVVHSAPNENATYYRVAADCPDICGITKGGLKPESASHYLAIPVTTLDRTEADYLMQNVQNGLVYCITISWGQGIERAQTSALFQVVQRYHAGAVSDGLASCVDKTGHAMGGSNIIPFGQICIATPINQCPLQPLQQAALIKR